MSKRITGLRQRNEIWWIDKIIEGIRVQESTRTADRAEAERYLVHRINELRQAKVYGVRPKRTFEQAAVYYLEKNAHKTSIERDAICLEAVIPFIGQLYLEDIHDGAVEPYLAWRRENGFKSSTAKRDLAVVRRILRLAAQSWRDENGLSWLLTPPLLQMPDWKDARKPRPITWPEQEALFNVLPDHLREMALFAVNTGCREQEVCGLSWEWEYPLPELQTSVFVIPGFEGVKNGEDRVIVLNSIAKAVVERQRGKHNDLVFPYKGDRVERMNNTGWHTARNKVHLQDVRVHDLKHTFGLRLRAAGVSFEDRQTLLGHTNGSVTTHYSAMEIGNMISLVERIVPVGNQGKITLLKPKSPTNPLHRKKSRARRAARK